MSSPAPRPAGSTTGGQRTARPAPGTPGASDSGYTTPSSPGRTATATSPKSSSRPSPSSRGDEPRKVRLTLSRVDPFSVMKISFLLSVAVTIAGVVVVAALWMMLQGMGVFSTLNNTLNELAQSTTNTGEINVLEILSFGRVLSLAIILGVADVILVTAIATLSAVIYNICAALVGGVSATFTDV
ncbi:DUF3566 domain-containing protein [Mobilicoccus caccae]|uniref:Membrane protein n=1 Tax=Mobilicoccus caccae TaxID=1859295 RepID=A0ABQ6IV37_9MICO|nr:DUF3566 domain-containing protein [Mobilicoccus caccae]GMA41800.1 membrane protein [Mobilicoccus caccae]